MSTSTALFDAVTALNSRIKQAAATATAEEMAYLGAAIEKIGGQVSLIDLAEHVENLKATLTTFLDQTELNLNQTLRDAIQNAMNDLSRVKNEHLSEMSVMQMNAKADITTHTDAANQSMLDTSATVLSQVMTAITNLTAAIDQATTAAAAIRDVQPITEADLYFFNA